MTGARFDKLWFNWEQPAVPGLLDLTFEACGDPFRRAFGFPFFTSILYYREEKIEDRASCQASWLLRLDEGVAVGRWLVEMLLVPSFANRLELSFYDACQSLLDVAARGRQAAARADLPTNLRNIAAFRDAFLPYYAIGAITEPVQWFCEATLDRHLVDSQEADVADSDGETGDARAMLFTSNEEPYATTIERSLLELALTDGHPDEAAIDRHVERFYWKATNYERAVSITRDDVVAELVELSEIDVTSRLAELETSRTDALERKASLLAQLPSRVRAIVLITDRFGSVMADRRKEIMNEALVALSEISERVADQLDVSATDLEMFSPAEFDAIAERGHEIADEAAARRSSYVQVLSPAPLNDEQMAAAISLSGDGDRLVSAVNEPAVAYGPGAVRFLAELDKRLGIFITGDETQAVCGDVVSVADRVGPTITAPCRIISDPLRQRAEFQSGEILVASSTTPDFVPLMRKAAAIVTNMGGMLQHAAIFAREERLPCIVGTGFATSAFRTGQLITLNLLSGEIAIDEAQDDC
jgi:phosphohistidine swiveling domain-containing protein